MSVHSVVVAEGALPLTRKSEVEEDGKVGFVQMSEKHDVSPAHSVSTHCGGSPARDRAVDEDLSLAEVYHREGEALIHKRKLKGEAVLAEKRVVCKKAQKMIDEAHNFGLCPHYASLLEKAKYVGYHEMKWPTNFTMFHLAAKKNNRQFVDFMVNHDPADLHAIDDFGKKPIDYACPKKRDSVFGLLHELMIAHPAAESAAETKYQQVKAGTWVDPEKEIRKSLKEAQCMAVVLERDVIAVGDLPGAKKASDLMSAYEVELMVPAEYKKCFKALGAGGWAAMEGKWPHKGETVLHWAAKHGKDELCRFLVLEYGADPKEEDGSGHDAITYAKLKRHRKLGKALLLKFQQPRMTKKKAPKA